MTDIDVPDWVALEAAKALHLHGADSMCSDTDWPDLTDSERSQYIGWAKASLRAALSAWVVPELFVSRDGIDAVRDARRRDVMAYTKAWNDAISSQMVPLYTLRQEKPE